MNKTEIIQSLHTHHQPFADYIRSLPADDFMHRKESKWTAGQQAEHIIKAVSPVAMAFSLPRFMPRLLFGLSKRSSKTYEELVAQYKAQLAKGGKASARYIPKPVDLQQQPFLPQQIMYYIGKICKQVEKITEDELDRYMLPHPLLGKLTLREMLYFTIYHVAHHHVITKRDVDIK